jgi:hypothetical protein
LEVLGIGGVLQGGAARLPMAGYAFITTMPQASADNLVNGWSV